MIEDHRLYLENLVASTGANTTVGELRAALQARFNLDRLVARKIVFAWLKDYPFKKIHI